MSDIDFDWVQLTESAATHFEKSQFSLAGELWEKALNVSLSLPDNDPRKAASLNNAGIGLRAAGTWHGAENTYLQALEAWDSASFWVQHMHLPQRARSSLFHLRMEQKHRKQYNLIAVQQHERILFGGQAATYNNLGELYSGMNHPEKAEASYDQALKDRTEAMGIQEAGTDVIRMNLSALSSERHSPKHAHSVQDKRPKRSMSFIEQAQKQGWIVDNPSEFTDEGRLMAAILLARIVDRREMERLDV